jgi:hypothetical protein
MAFMPLKNLAELEVPLFRAERAIFESLGAVARRGKGKIPRAEWPSILDRHKAGATFAEIAHSYDCTASAIRYVVKRASAARAPQANETASAPGAALGIDRELRERVHRDLAAFLVAFDSLCAEFNETTRASLIEATDRLMRTGAKTRLALEGSDDTQD